jgi:hypothetical protein
MFITGGEKAQGMEIWNPATGGVITALARG